LNYGVEHTFQRDDVKEKIRSTIMNNFGEESIFCIPSVRDQIKKTWINNFGYDNPMRCPEIRRRSMRKYTFRGVNFDSSHEIALYIWLSESGIDVEYEPDVMFRYEFKGKERMYFPDFRIEGYLLEVKGDQFFKENGQMWCPYRNKDWSDVQYEEVCQTFEAKHQCMISHGVYILRSSSPDIREAVRYVEQKYGTHFLKSLRQDDVS